MTNLSKEWINVEKEYTEIIFSTKDDFSIGFYQEGIKQRAFTVNNLIKANSFLKIRVDTVWTK